MLLSASKGRCCKKTTYVNAGGSTTATTIVLLLSMGCTTTPAGRAGGGVGRTSGRPALSRGGRVSSRGAPGVAATSGRSGGWRCPRWRPGRRKNVRFYAMIFGLFWLIFACLLVILPGLVRFFKTLSRFPPGCVPTSDDRACRRARGSRHLGHDTSWRSRGEPHPPPARGRRALHIRRGDKRKISFWAILHVFDARGHSST